MWLFKKRKQKQVDESKPSVSDKVAGKIAGAGIKVQTAFSNKMNKFFENMNSRRLKALLVLFIVCGGGYSVYLLVAAIVNPQKTNFRIEQVDIPKHFNKAGDEQIAPDAHIDDETYYNIQTFKKTMDSLKQFRKKEYDSIIHERPGLLDSVQMLEQIYHSQKQN